MSAIDAIIIFFRNFSKASGTLPVFFTFLLPCFSIVIEYLLHILIKPENRMLNDGEKAGFSGKKREISGI